MKIKFDAYEMANSPLHEEGVCYHRPVIIRPQTITAEDIAQTATEETSLTPIDIVAVISSLSQNLYRQLLNGNTVHIDGLGTFKLSLKFRDPAMPLEDIKATNVQISGINFTPDHKLLAALRQNASFERKPTQRSSVVTEAEAVIALREYFAEGHRDIRSQLFMRLLGLKYGRAITLLNTLVGKNKLTVSKIGQTNYYFPTATL